MFFAIGDSRVFTLFVNTWKPVSVLRISFALVWIFIILCLLLVWIFNKTVETRVENSLKLT